MRSVTLLLLLLVIAPGALTAQEWASEDFVGAPRCLDCHNALETGHSAHERALGRGDTALFRCEACHGPGKDHAQRQASGDWTPPPVSFNRDESAFLGNTQCLACHDDSLDHAWENSAHDLGALSCDACHGVHEAQDPASAPDASLAVCGRCHDDLLVGEAVQGHHPFLEQDVGCDGCHNPHGDLFSMQCGDCHEFTPETLASQGQRVRQFHVTAMGKELDCARCHGGVAHGVPDWVEAWQTAVEAGQ